MKRTITLLLVLALLSTLTGCAQSRYKEAETLYSQKQYQEAAEAFEELADYEDAPERAKECRYQIALALKEEGKYQEAAEAFAALSGYQDSSEMQIECICLLADEQVQEGKVTQAVEALTALMPDQQAEAALASAFGWHMITYVEEINSANDQWGDYVADVWIQDLQKVVDSTPRGGDIDLPKVDMAAPQVKQMLRHVEKSKKIADELETLYTPELLAMFQEEGRTAIESMFAAMQVMEKQFSDLDNWVATMLFYATMYNNTSKANNALMDALWQIQDASDVLIETYNIE